MDVTPQVINEVEFHQKMRGYDPDEVDDFLERVAVAVGEMQEHLGKAGDRIAAAERRASEAEARAKDAASAPSSAAPAPSTGDYSSADDDAEMMRRTLVLAQRTADAAIKEAEETAQLTLATAQEQVDTMYREAEEHARRVIEEAEAEATNKGQEARDRLTAEVAALEEAREALRADHGILDRHLDEQRLRLRSSVAELQRLLDDPTRLRLAPTPTLSEVSRPSASAPSTPAAKGSTPAAKGTTTAEPDSEPEPATRIARERRTDAPAPKAVVREPEPEPEPAPAPAPAPAPVIDLDEIDEIDDPITGGVTFTASDDTDPSAHTEAVTPPQTDDEEAAWARFVGDDGPPTQSIRLDEADDDAYLAELRKAMIDDHTGDDVYDTAGFDGRAKTRFGRRR